MDDATYSDYANACDAYFEAFKATQPARAQTNPQPLNAAFAVLQNVYARLPNNKWVKSPGTVRSDVFGSGGEVDATGKPKPAPPPIAIPLFGS